MATATFDTHDVYPLRLNSRESKVVQAAIANANGVTKVADSTARLALSPSDGDVVVQLDNHTMYIYNSSGSLWIAVTGGGGGIPGGLDGQIQFNDSSAFEGDAKFKWDNALKQVNLNGYKIEPLGSETLLDNQIGVVLFDFAHATEKFMVVEYSISRGTDTRMGHLKLATNGTTVTLDDVYVNTADIGVTFSASVNGTQVEIKYSTTSLGTSATMKHSKRKWI